MAAATVAQRKQPSKWHLYVAAVAISLFIVIPIYLIAVAAFTPTSVAAGQPAAVPVPAVVTPPLIVPPVAVSRRLPPWPDKLLVPLRAFATMELVIDTSGAVVTARILESAHPVYDEMLVGVASTWRYRPATRNGRPIAYTMAQRIDLPR